MKIEPFFFIDMFTSQLVKSTSIIIFTAMLASCASSEPEEAKQSVRDKEQSKNPNRMFSFIDEINTMKYKPTRSLKNLKTYDDFINVANDAHEQCAYTEAAEFAKSAIKLKPKSGYAHYLRGKTLAASAYGDDTEALEEMLKAIDLGYENGDLYEYLAKVYDGKKEYRKAIAALTKAISYEGNTRNHYKYRGALYDLVGEEKKAESDYTKNIELELKKSQAYIARGKFFESHNKFEEALKDANKALEFEKRETDELSFRAGVLAKLGKNKEAIKDLTELLERNPNDDDSTRLRGDLYARQKNYKAAIKDYSKAIKNAPDQARASYEARARIYKILGENKKAKADLESVKQIYARPALKPLYELKKN